jgi:hypothetical protein
MWCETFRRGANSSHWKLSFDFHRVEENTLYYLQMVDAQFAVDLLSLRYEKLVTSNRCVPV